MSVSLWQRLDDSILSFIQAALGRDGDYTTHVLRYSELGELWQPEKWTKPALIVYSRDVRLVTEEHGGSAGSTHVTSRYGYAVVAVADGDSYGEARNAAQELLRRVILVLRAWPALLAAVVALDASDEEQPRRLRWTGATMRVRPRTSNSNSNDRPHWAEASLGFEIEARQ